MSAQPSPKGRERVHACTRANIEGQMEIRRPPVLNTDPPELLVYDEPTRCPYLPDQTARLPMRLPSRPLDRVQFSRRLEAGDRRQGLVLYRPSCQDCQACEPIRILVEEFKANKTQRRIWRRGHEKFDVHLATPAPNPEKVELYNRHKRGRALLGDGEEISAGGYDAFLVDSCTESFELRYLHKGELMGVAVVDRAQDALSAVYTYFDPEFGPSSPGVFSILTQLELCRRWELSYLYLGLYVEECKAMAYKANYLPHERRIGASWERFDPASSET